MINCQYININEPIAFQTIVGEKNNPGKAILLGITHRVLPTYQTYIDRFNSILSTPSSAFLPAEVVEKQALQSCYSSPTQSFEIIKGLIRSQQPNELKSYCPYCLLDRPKTLDHYIGQTEFPEFSILVRNLIPCCYDCNQKKGENWRAGIKRKYIHFYNDQFISDKFLYAVLIYDKTGFPSLKYYLRKPRSLSYLQYSIVKSHFKELELLSEYRQAGSQVMASETEVLKKAIRNGQFKGRLRQNLRESSISYARRLGVNYWRAVLYETLANSNQFINSL